MRRIEGNWFCPSTDGSVEAWRGPVVLRTLSAGTAVSARFLVMIVGMEGRDSAVVVTVGAGPPLGRRVEVDCCRMGAVGSQPLAAPGGLGVLLAWVFDTGVCS
jgi:hypothetical protein